MEWYLIPLLCLKYIFGTFDSQLRRRTKKLSFITGTFNKWPYSRWNPNIDAKLWEIFEFFCYLTSKDSNNFIDQFIGVGLYTIEYKKSDKNSISLRTTKQQQHACSETGGQVPSIKPNQVFFLLLLYRYYFYFFSRVLFFVYAIPPTLAQSWNGLRMTWDRGTREEVVSFFYVAPHNNQWQ
jgi:hypothetical protein